MTSFPTPDLSDLLRRVEGAEGADRSIDCALAVILDGFETDDYFGDGDLRYIHVVDGVRHIPGQAPDMLVPRYTASLDAALGLVERAHAPPQEFAWSCGCDFGPHHHAHLSIHTAGMDRPANYTANAATVPLALLAALLRSLAT